MWSYKDVQNNKIETRLSIDDIRDLIKKGKITATTPLKHYQFNDWLAAKETLFFNDKTPTLVVKIKNNGSGTVSAPAISPKGKRKLFRGSPFPVLLFTLFLLAALCPVIYQLYKLKQYDNSLLTLKNELIEQQDVVYKEKFLANKLDQVTKDYNKVLLSISKSNMRAVDKAQLVDLHKNRIIEVEGHLAILDQLPNTKTDLKKLINTTHQLRAYHLKSVMPIYSIGLLFVFFIMWVFHLKSANCIYKKRGIIWGVLHCVPVLQFFFYSIFSAKWNLYSQQRQNRLLLTLPINIAQIASFGFSLYLFYTNKSMFNCLCLLTLSTCLWGILQIRQIQMTSYAISNVKN